MSVVISCRAQQRHFISGSRLGVTECRWRQHWRQPNAGGGTRCMRRVSLPSIAAPIVGSSAAVFTASYRKARGNPSELGLLNTQGPYTGGIKTKNRHGGCLSSYVIAVVDLPHGQGCMQSHGRAAFFACCRRHVRRETHFPFQQNVETDNCLIMKH